jgi:hypothetical protein
MNLRPNQFLALAVLTAALLPCAAPAGNAPAAKEELLATLRENTKVFTPDGAHLIAWRERRGQFWTMVINGVAGPQYANLGVPVFSPDGRHTAYTAQKNPGAGNPAQAVIVHDGREGPAFRQVAGLQFTRDGKHVAYLAGEGGRWRPYLDDRALEPTASQASAALWVNADGSRWAYWREDGIVVDGQPRPQHKSRGGGERVDTPPVFSPDGKRLAYRVAQGAKTIVVVDDKESPAYETATDPTFSPDGKHVAYVAVRDRRVYPVIDGIEGPPLFKLLNNAIVFSPDSTRFGYFGLPQNIAYWWLPKGTDPRRVSGIFLLGGKLEDVAEALKGDPMDLLSVRVENVTGPVWSATGGHWAYARPEGMGTLVVTAGATSAPFDAVAGLAIDADGQPIFAARKGSTWIAMRGDEAIGTPMDELLSTHLSPDGRHAIWVGRRGTKQFATTAAHEGKAYDAISAMSFNDDGTELRYIARDGERYLRVSQALVRPRTTDNRARTTDQTNR